MPSYNDIYREKDEDDNYITKVYTYDLEYALITDNRLPDMYYGRIPNNSVDTLCAIVNKIESYEKDKAYFNNRQFIGTAHFQDNGGGYNSIAGDGIEDCGFTRSIETVCQTVADMYKTVTRLYGYKEEDKGTPISWKEDTDPSFPFPENFNDYFIEGGWQLWANLEGPVNKGADYVVAQMHGSNEGWIFPQFYSQSLFVFKNTTYPVFFSMSCDTGRYYYSNNFARKLLSMPNAGCSAIFAATKPIEVNFNELYLLAIMNSIWASKQFNYYGNNNTFDFGSFGEGTSTLGEAINLATSKMLVKGKYSTQDIRAYHIFGDPALHLIRGCERTIGKDKVITYGEGALYVNTVPIGPCDISFYDTGTTPPTLKKFYGNHATFETSTPKQTKIYITRPNCNSWFVDGFDPDAIGFGGPWTIINSVSNPTESELSISIETDNEEVPQGYSLRIAESSGIQTNHTSDLTITDPTVNYQIKDSRNRIFFISLMKGDEIIDSKTYLKR